MTMTSLISGSAMLLSGFVFLLSMMVASGPKKAKVGDVFAHINSGSFRDPDKSARPFVQIYIVEEVRGGQAHVYSRSIYLDSKVVEGRHWQSAYCPFDTKLSE